MSDLEPISPEEAKRLYVKDRREELADKTVRTQKLVLNQFDEWCAEDGIENLNELTGRDLRRHRISMNDRGLANATVRNRLSTLRVFIQWCETIEAVSDGLHEKIIPPTLTSEDRRDTMIHADEAKSALEYLRTYQYASREHALFALLWHTGMRMGAARGIDLDDVSCEEQHVDVWHQPETDTPLKNGDEGERSIALKQSTTEAIREYIDVHRIPTTDDHEREPLFTTKRGRLSKTKLRRTIYAVTRPCYYENECPHGRSEVECDSATKIDDAYKCPSTVSPHPIRRGSITHHLTEDVPEEVVSDRMDVSNEIVDKHYDRRSESEKREVRRGYLENI